MAIQEHAYGTGTHEGAIRGHNEDGFLAAPEVGLWVVADGMGGHEAGEVASALALQTVREQVEAGAALVEAIREAHRAVRQAGREGRGSPNMGTTVVAALFGESHFELAWVGDSRAYIWAGGKLRKLSRDHSLVQQMVDHGELSQEETATHPEKNVITQAVGGDQEAIKPERETGRLADGDRLLLCSDGLTDELAEPHIAEILERNRHPQEAVDELLQEALESGGRDNITAVVIDAASHDPGPGGTHPFSVEGLKETGRENHSQSPWGKRIGWLLVIGALAALAYWLSMWGIERDNTPSLQEEAEQPTDEGQGEL